MGPPVLVSRRVSTPNFYPPSPPSSYHAAFAGMVGLLQNALDLHCHYGTPIYGALLGLTGWNPK